MHTNRKTGQRKRLGKANWREARDRRIYGKLRTLVSLGESMHKSYGEKIEPLSVFYGKPDRPNHWELSPFPMLMQDNGRPMPQWKELSPWMKVMIATMMGHQWELLTININLHPDLEAKLISLGDVRGKMREAITRNIRRSLGSPREFFFVIEGQSKDTLAPTGLHLHGAICVHERQEIDALRSAVLLAAGQTAKRRVPRALHTKPFETIRVAYVDYLFKFAKTFDARLEERRLAMSRPMTQAASTFWQDITRVREWEG